MIHDGLPQEKIALFRTIAAEGFLMRHFIDSLVHGFNYGRCQRLRHIADAEGNDLCLRMAFLISRRSFFHFCKQIGTLKIQVCFITMCH